MASTGSIRSPVPPVGRATAASAGAQAWSDGHDAETACAAALKSIEQDGAEASRTKGWCKVNPKTGEITITLRKRAKTMLAWRLGFTAGYTKVVAVESGAPSSCSVPVVSDPEGDGYSSAVPRFETRTCALVRRHQTVLQPLPARQATPTRGRPRRTRS